MSYRRDLWEVAAEHNGVVTLAAAEDAGVPAVEVRKLASRGALTSYGNGVYTHNDVPVTLVTQPAVAVALGGEGAFLQRESVFDLLQMGQFNPRQIRVGVRRRVRRNLPEWVQLEYRPDVIDGDLTHFHEIASTTVERALADLQNRIPPNRLEAVRAEALQKGLLSKLALSQ